MNVIDIATLFQSYLLTLLPYGISGNGNIIIRLSAMHVIVLSIYVMSTIIIFSFIRYCAHSYGLIHAMHFISLAVGVEEKHSDRAQVNRMELSRCIVRCSCSNHALEMSV